MAMKKGTKVKIKGLVNAAIHNGKIGIVVKEQEVASSSLSSSSSSGGGGTTSRLGVKLLDSGKILAIKMDNLEPITTTKTKTTTMTNKTEQKKKTPDNEISKQPKQQLCPTANADAAANAATTITPPLNNNNNEEPKQRTLKRDYGLLKEFDGNSYDPNVLVLYYHFADRAYDCFNGTEYITQMLRYYKNGITVKLILPRRIGANTYHIIGLQHPQHNKNTLCEVAFNCGRSFCGICKYCTVGN